MNPMEIQSYHHMLLKIFSKKYLDKRKVYNPDNKRLHRDVKVVKKDRKTRVKQQATKRIKKEIISDKNLFSGLLSSALKATGKRKYEDNGLKINNSRMNQMMAELKGKSLINDSFENIIKQEDFVDKFSNPL